MPVRRRLRRRAPSVRRLLEHRTPAPDLMEEQRLRRTAAHRGPQLVLARCRVGTRLRGPEAPRPLAVRRPASGPSVRTDFPRPRPSEEGARPLSGCDEPRSNVATAPRPCSRPRYERTPQRLDPNPGGDIRAACTRRFSRRTTMAFAEKSEREEPAGRRPAAVTAHGARRLRFDRDGTRRKAHGSRPQTYRSPH